MGIKIKPYDPSNHEEKLRLFIKTAYGRDDYPLMSSRFFSWQFRENPYGKGKHTVIVAEREDEIIGMLGYIPSLLVTPRGPCKACWPVNLMVLPKYRQLGLGVFLLRELIEDKWFIVNPGSSKAGQVVCEGLGLHPMGKLYRYIFVPDPIAAKPLHKDDAYLWRPRVLQPSERKHKVVQDDSLDEKIEHLPVHFELEFPPYSMIRDGRFLNWRYLKHPVYEYKFIWEIRNEERKGLLIFHSEIEPRTNLEVWRIVELIADIEGMMNLLVYIAEEARIRNVALVDFVCSFQLDENILNRIGYLSSDKSPGDGFAYLFQPLSFKKTGVLLLTSPIEDEPNDLKNWYVTRGDSDQDRPNIMTMP